MQELEDAGETGLFLAGPLAGSVFPTDTDRALAIALDQVRGPACDDQACDYLWSLQGLAESQGEFLAV